MPTALCIRCLDYQYCMRCGLCRGPWYCSRHCQKDDWPRHKKECHIYMATECLKKDSPLPWDCIEKIMGFTVKQPAYWKSLKRLHGLFLFMLWRKSRRKCDEEQLCRDFLRRRWSPRVAKHWVCIFRVHAFDFIRGAKMDLAPLLVSYQYKEYGEVLEWVCTSRPENALWLLSARCSRKMEFGFLFIFLYSCSSYPRMLLWIATELQL